MPSTRIRDVMIARGISITKMAEMSDLPIETVKNIYYGKTNDPKITTVMQIAHALNMSIDCLVGQCPHSANEKTLLQYFRSCGKHGQSLITLTAKYEALMAKNDRESPDRHKVPCLMPRHEIYKGIVYEDCDIVEIETSVKEAYCGIKMFDNNFVPIFCAGDIILLENRFPRHNEYGVFYIDQKMYVRRFIEEQGQYRLKSIHSRNTDIIVKNLRDIEYVGTYCGVIRE